MTVTSTSARQGGEGATNAHPVTPSPRHPVTPSPRLPLPPLRILHLVSSFQVGGMEQFVLRMAREQQQRGHQVAVLG
jgi:hypothetical protein